MRRFPSHFAVSGGAFRFRGVVVPYPTIVVCAPSDLSSVPVLGETRWLDSLGRVREEDQSDVGDAWLAAGQPGSRRSDRIEAAAGSEASMDA